MKVLWVCNTIPRILAQALGIIAGNKEGWLDGALKRIADSASDKDSDSSYLKLAVACPMDAGIIPGMRSGAGISVTIDDMSVTVYGYPDDTIRPDVYDAELESVFSDILDGYTPDIVHVFGTEYGHSLAVAKAVDSAKKDGEKIRLLIGIQGIISECAKAYTCELPQKVVDSYSLRDILRNDNIRRQQEKFAARGVFETEAVKYATDITGRTAFDMEWSHGINPDAEYHHMNETLRTEFYEGTWDATECDRHVIFMSQGDYPLKGLHRVLEQMPEIIKNYKDAKLVVAGMNLTDRSVIMKRIKLSGYGKYLIRLIKDNNLKDHVMFTGPLDAGQMHDRLLKCHTYLCASSIENSPNSMGEAMLLGVPVLAPAVGGIPSLAQNGTEALLYNEMTDLPGLIDRIWSDDGFATELGATGMNRAKKTHDADANMNRLLEIYVKINEQKD